MASKEDLSYKKVTTNTLVARPLAEISKGLSYKKVTTNTRVATRLARLLEGRLMGRQIPGPEDRQPASRGRPIVARRCDGPEETSAAQRRRRLGCRAAARAAAPKPARASKLNRPRASKRAPPRFAVAFPGPTRHGAAGLQEPRPWRSASGLPTEEPVAGTRCKARSNESEAPEPSMRHRKKRRGRVHLSSATPHVLLPATSPRRSSFATLDVRTVRH